MTLRDQTAITDASAELADAVKPTHAEVAQMIAEYAALKTANRLTKDGEVIDRKKANRQEDGLNRAIKDALALLGETEMFVEGVGAVRLRENDAVGYRLDALHDEELSALVTANLLTVKRGDVQEQIEGTTLKRYKPEWAWLKDYEVRGSGATQLIFEEAK